MFCDLGGERIVKAKRFSKSRPDLIGLVMAFVLVLGWLAPNLPDGGVPAANAAEAPAPGSGKRLPRMYDGAPPQIPHNIAGLEGACLGCHLEGAQGATIVPHPDRPTCQQCHVTQDPSVKPLVKNTFGGLRAPSKR
jgi:nitrate reductase cytochrome c-type subunit